LLASGIVCACSSDEHASIGVAPSLLFPHALLDNVTKVTVSVIDTTSGADCDTTTGNPTGDVSKPILTKDLASSGCASGAKFCGDLTITESDDALVFTAAGFDSGNNEVATGCNKATINQDAEPVSITMKRFIQPANCGDGTIQPTEQCDPPGASGDPVCDTNCHTEEILLSGGHSPSSSSGTVAGKAGDKTNPMLVWPAQSGAPGRLWATFSDISDPSATKVTMRVLSDNLEQYASQGPEFQQYSFFMPNAVGGTFPPGPGAGNQSAPSGASVSGSYYVAYQDDSAGSLDVYIRSFDNIFGAQQNDGLAVNGAQAGKQDLASLAANASGAIVIAWQDETDGSVHARPFNTSTSAFGTAITLSTGAGNVNPVIASNGSGFVCVWQSGNNISFATLGADGSLLSTAKNVNDATHTGAQSHPSVAGTSDGTFAVVWEDGTSQDIFVQRYSAAGVAVAGDQATAINDLVTTGNQNAPTIAAGSNFFVAAWADDSTGHIRARLLGKSAGFLFDNVDGQSDEFQADTGADSSRQRANPTAAVGGAGPFIAIGWEDKGPGGVPGIYTRRFPLPAQ
ncbi:MAG: hypothetical protein ABI183_11860, partial [Polyangiaceae bacterium]